MKAGLGLGSNLGDRLSHLQEAAAFLQSLSAADHFLTSRIFETKPEDCPPGSPTFLNAVVEIDTSLSHRDLLVKCQEFEIKIGRPEKHARNSPRIIDVDILYFGDLEIEEENLIIPHPRMKDRTFVLLPLRDIRPDLVSIGDLDSDDDSCRPIESSLTSDL